MTGPACLPPARSAPPAQYNLGLLLDKGRHGGLPDPEAAVRWWRRAADQGHAPALHCLALRFMQLPPAARRPQPQGGAGGLAGGLLARAGLPRSEREAVRLWRRAAEQRHGASLLCLALCVEQGLGGCRVDGSRALELVQQSLDEGHEPARRHLPRLRVAVAGGGGGGLGSLASDSIGGGDSEAGRFSTGTSPFWVDRPAKRAEHA